MIHNELSSEEKKYLAIELGIRRDKCNFMGHVSPNGVFCEYCHRSLVYKNPYLDSIVEERKRLLLESLPAFRIEEEKEREITFQKFSDLFRGLRILETEDI